MDMAFPARRTCRWIRRRRCSCSSSRSACRCVTGAFSARRRPLIGSRADPIEALRGAGPHDRGARGRAPPIAGRAAGRAVAGVDRLRRAARPQPADNLQDRTSGSGPRVATSPSSHRRSSMVPGDELPIDLRAHAGALLQMPGVANAAFSLYSPMSGDNWSADVDRGDGRGTSERSSASWNASAPATSTRSGHPARPRAGRSTSGTAPDSPRVAIVSETFARRFFGDADPIGRRIGFTSSAAPGAEIEIIGVVGDAKYQDGRRAPPTRRSSCRSCRSSGTVERGAAARGSSIDRSHYPQAIVIQAPRRRAGLRNGTSAARLRRWIAGIIVRSAVSMEEQVARHFDLERLIARLTVGVRARRAAAGVPRTLRRDVAVGPAPDPRDRHPDGGRRHAVAGARTVLREAGLQLAVGVLLGVLAAYVAGRLLESYLYQVSGRDPWMIAAAVGVLGTCAIAAALGPGPARGASGSGAGSADGVDPTSNYQPPTTIQRAPAWTVGRCWALGV